MNPFTVVVLVLGIGGGIGAVAGITHSVVHRTWRAPSDLIDAKLVRCPVCSALPGHPCISREGNRSIIHGPRVAIWHADPNSPYIQVYECSI